MSIPEPDARLTLPHISRATLLQLDLPDGTVRYHNGVGNIKAGGFEWIGVADPVFGRLAGLSEIQTQAFGKAATVDVSLFAVTPEYVRSIYVSADQIEGSGAKIWMAFFDPFNEEQIGDLVHLFTGRVTSPKLMRQRGTRMIQITLESIFSGKNFPYRGRWNGADQRRRYAGDRGFDEVNVPVTETFQ